MVHEVENTGLNFSRDLIVQNTTAQIHGENTSRDKSNPGLINQLQRRNSTGSTPRLIRHVSTSRAASPTHMMQSRTSSPSPTLQMPNQSKSDARRAPSPSRFMRNSSVSASPSRRISSRASTPVRQLSSPAQLLVGRDNKTAGRVTRRRSIPTGRVSNHHVTAMAAASVFTSPRRHRKVNGNIGPSRHLEPVNRTRHPTAQKTVSYGGTLSNGDGEGFLRTLDSIPAHSGSRSAYDFVEAKKRSRKKIKRNSSQADIFDVQLDLHDDEDSEVSVDDKPWLPTGIYAVFLITLWTAVVRLVDSVEENGPVNCTNGEETRLWICAASFSLVQGLAEAFWQRKNLLKVLFSMTCLFGYFIISHVQPLSCRVGADKVTEISKWQSAINFFVSAMLGIRIYQHIQELMLEKKSRKARRKRSQVREEPDEFEGLPERVL